MLRYVLTVSRYTTNVASFSTLHVMERQITVCELTREVSTAIISNLDNKETYTDTLNYLLECYYIVVSSISGVGSYDGLYEACI